MHHKAAENARSDLITFAELIKSPEHIHTYAIQRNQFVECSFANVGIEDVIKKLEKWSRYAVPENVIFSSVRWVAVLGQ